MGPPPRPARRRWSAPRRRASLRLLATAVLAATAGVVAATAVGRAEEVRAAYGEVVDVPVAVHDLPAGTVVAEADVAVRALPRALVPAGAAAEVVGRTVRDPVLAGEVVAEARLGGAGGGPAALLRPGRRAVVVPVDDRSLVLAVGDHVDVLAPDDRSSPEAAASAVRVARTAEVLAVDDLTVTLGVLVGEAPGVARAVMDGAVALALVGPAP